MVNKGKVSIRLAEFFVVGMVMGVIEDLIAIHFATNAKITVDTFKVAVVVAVPFAVFSELVVDAEWIRRKVASYFGRRKK